jgi:predicted ATPase/transcriptional regulator with XRE-family HTH domain
MEKYIAFPDWLRKRRREIDLTQTEFAAKVGCSVDYIKSLEAAERRPSKEFAKRLAECLELDESQFARFIAVARRTNSPNLQNELSRPDYLSAINSASAELPPTNIVLPGGKLVGRNQEIARVVELLRQAGVRLLTLTGPGGVGKTRLALHAALQLQGEYSEGVLLVSLASVLDSASLLSAIAGVLGVAESPGKSLLQTVQSYLAKKNMLLVLDNFEQISGGTSILGQILAATHHLKILVTSRVVLHTSWEFQWRVPPLDIPRDLQGLTSDSITEYAAMQLFAERAMRINPSVTTDETSIRAIAAICQKLDGLPLAIELAAARTNLFSATGLLRRLGENEDLLSSTNEELPKRQQKMSRTIEWSYRLLKEDQQRLFRSLAVFIGGCNLDAAELICTSDTDRDIDIIEGLASLVDSSLLSRDVQPDGEPRFHFLETIKEYALKQLQGDGRLTRLRNAHAIHFLSLAESISSKLATARYAALFSRLDLEYDNIRGALQWLLENSDVVLALRLCLALGQYWQVRGKFAEGRRWLEAVLSMKYEDYPAIRASASRLAGNLARAQGQYRPAKLFLEDSLKLSRLTNQAGEIVQSLHDLGLIYWYQHDYEEAEAHLNEALQLNSGTGDLKLTATVLNQLGLIARRRSRFDEARDYLSRSLSIWKTIGDEWQVATTQNNLGALEYHQKNYSLAEDYLLDSLSLRRVLQDVGGESLTLSYLGRVARAQDRTDMAILYSEQALVAAQEWGLEDKVITAIVLHNLAHLACHKRDFPTAINYFRQSLTLYAETQDMYGIAFSLDGLAGVAASFGDLMVAGKLYQVAENLLSILGMQLDPADRIAHERSIPRTLSPDEELTWERAITEGNVLTTEQAIEIGIGLVDPSSAS